MNTNDTITIAGVPLARVTNGPVHVFANATISDTAGIGEGGALFDLATFTVSGGTLSEPTGLGDFRQTGPDTYAFGETSPAFLTQDLRTLVFTPTAASGHVSLHVQDNNRTTPDQPIATADAGTVIRDTHDMLADFKVSSFGRHLKTAHMDSRGLAKPDFAQSMGQMLTALHHA